VIDKLRAFPVELRALLATAPADKLRQRAADGTFALVEQAWHLADLEAEGYGARIEKMLAEDEPELPDFRGDVVAEERRYLELELEPALRKFEETRARNVGWLETLTNEQLQRGGEQEGVGRVTIARVAGMMAEHDAGHAREVRALLDELDRLTL
jgi:DinB superfamily